MANRLTIAFLVLLVLAASTLFCESSVATYQKGTLSDLRSFATDAPPGRAQFTYCLAVDAGEMTFLSRYDAYWSHAFDPSSLVVGDPIELRIKGNDLYIRKSDGKELKTRLTRRERNIPDRPHANCGEPVSVK